MNLGRELRALAALADRGELGPDVTARLERAIECQALRLRRRNLWLAIAGAYVNGSASRLYRIGRHIERSSERQGTAPLAVALENALALGPLPGRRQLANILAAQRTGIAADGAEAAATGGNPRETSGIATPR